MSEGMVLAVDVGTDRIVATIHVGGVTVGIATGPDGAPWVAAQGS